MATESASPEGRDKKWLDIEKAIAQLEFEDARKLLEGVSPDLEKQYGSVSTDQFDQYMLSEFNHIADALLRNEEDGEKRAAFFVSFSGAVGGLLSFFLGKKSGLEYWQGQLIVMGVLVVLFALGYVTFVRVVTRNVASDCHKLRLNKIRRYFLRSPRNSKMAFAPFNPYRFTPRKPWTWTQIGKGGWLVVLALANAVLLGLFAACIALFVNWWFSALAGLLAAFVAWIWLNYDASSRYRHDFNEMSDVPDSTNEIADL
jgi:hypothetical protein